MTTSQAEMLANRVKKRLRHLQKWAKRSGIEAFRLYDRDIPEIPLVLDLYGGIISGALYKRPYEKDPEEEALWLESMKQALSQSLGLAPENIIIKQRERKRARAGLTGQGKTAQYEKISDQGIIREIREGNYKFRVNLSDYLDTGLFLDRRCLRSLIGADARSKRVLNLFCYTGSFSIYVAGGGAISTDSVDLSNTYLNWAHGNFVLNGFKAKFLQKDEFFTPAARNESAQSESNHTIRDNIPTTGDNIPTESDKIPTTSDRPANRLIRADVTDFLARAQGARYTWDVIILDPPAFSNSKMSRADFDLNRDYTPLLSNCLSLLSPNGKLWFSASAKSFKADAAALENALTVKFPGLKVTDISGKIVDEDFRGRKTPRTFLMSNEQ